MKPHSLPHRSYLLRCWAECDEDGALRVWRFSLEELPTGRRQGFASVQALAAALEAELLIDRQGPSEARPGGVR